MSCRCESPGGCYYCDPTEGERQRVLELHDLIDSYEQEIEIMKAEDADQDDIDHILRLIDRFVGELEECEA